MTWIENLIITAITLLGGFVGGGWFAKRKAKADAKGKEIENEGTETNNFALQVKAINDIIDTWRSAFNDLKVTYDLKYESIAEQYNSVREQNNALKEHNVLIAKRLDLLNDVVERNTTMQAEIETLQSRVKVLESENERLRKESNKLLEQSNRLKNEVAELKSQTHGKEVVSNKDLKNN